MSNKKMPPEVKAALVALLMSEIGPQVMGGPIAPPEEQDETPTHKRRPATVREVMAFNSPFDPPLAVGDRVRWREHLRNGGWPGVGEVAVVSQIIDPPTYSLGKLSYSEGAERHDMALAFMSHASEDGEDRGMVMAEFVFDSRRFERMGDDFPRDE